MNRLSIVMVSVMCLLVAAEDDDIGIEDERVEELETLSKVFWYESTYVIHKENKKGKCVLVWFCDPERVESQIYREKGDWERLTSLFDEHQSKIRLLEVDSNNPHAENPAFWTLLEPFSHNYWHNFILFKPDGRHQQVAVPRTVPHMSDFIKLSCLLDTNHGGDL